MRPLAALPALALAACVGTPPPEPVEMLPAASLYEPISTPAATFDNPLAAAQYFARYDPGAEGGSTMDLMSRRFTSRNTLVMVFMVEGYADDSVEGEQWRIELERVSAGWRVTAAGRRFKCYRGSNPGVWQRNLCP